MSEVDIKSPKISVCLTHYNRPKKLAATLASLARQTRMPDEIFLWDDCSPNDPTEVATEWKNKFPHFVYHRNEKNLNMPANLNAVISQATGDYIANLHDADEFDPCLIEKWVEALVRFPSAGLVFCGLESPGHGKVLPRMRLDETILPKNDGIAFFERFFRFRWSSPIWGTAMVRKEVYEKLMPFRSQFRNWADVDMWMRIALNYDIAYVNLPLIKLDQEETPLRQFRWDQMCIQHRMCESSIQEYCKKTGKSQPLHLGLQRLNLWLRWMRHMASGLRERDRKRLVEGLSFLPQVLLNTVPPQRGDGYNRD